jgi:uncharacterized protein with PIN domain
MTNPMHRTEQTSRPAGRSGLRARLAERRAARAARVALERELSGYTSAADIAELDAIMTRSEQHDADLTRIVDQLRLTNSR